MVIYIHVHTETTKSPTSVLFRLNVVDMLQQSENISKYGHRIEHRIFNKRGAGRPVIWNKTLECYKDKHLTKKAWDTICKEIRPEFEDMEDANKTEFRKYTNIYYIVVKSNYHSRQNF